MSDPRWNALISFEKMSPAPQPRQLMQQGRSCFQKDYDRIIYSAAFRRLGDKTQVVPLPGNDFVRNRLTHSLEVACVARSLGEIVWSKLAERQPEHPLILRMSAADLGAAIAAASLAHDIGNPPFGHFGEAAISDFFRRNSPALTGLSEAQRKDLQHFEGNATGFRILTRTPPAISGIPGGFHLTLSTLAAFCKYPCDTSALVSGQAAKYNAFQSDKQTLLDLAHSLQLLPLTRGGFARHPFAYLVEAADDICNVMIDFEDGHKLGLIPDEALLSHFRTLASGPKVKSSVDDRVLEKCYVPSEQAAYLRVKAIHHLTDQIAELFLHHESAILDGVYVGSLLDDLPPSQRTALEAMSVLTDRCVYSHEPVVEVELAGHAVIHGLLTMLIDEMYSHRGSARSQRLKKLIPEPYFRTLQRDWFEDDYENILNLACFVSDMTDSFALSLYRKLSGIELPSLRR
ncbi:MAG: dGTP triphosphohydrolase [Candidatus Sericytochromatia bacterium]